MKPTLWRWRAYFSPGLPSPARRRRESVIGFEIPEIGSRFRAPASDLRNYFLPFSGALPLAGAAAAAPAAGAAAPAAGAAAPAAGAAAPAAAAPSAPSTAAAPSA